VHDHTAAQGRRRRLRFPAFDDYWWSEHNVVVRKDGEEMRLGPRPVVKAADLAPLVEQRKKTERDASKEPIMDHGRGLTRNADTPASASQTTKRTQRARPRRFRSRTRRAARNASSALAVGLA
jgi:hypothetical protein